MDDLHDRMTAGMADDGPRPPLDDLWTRGRAARRRSRASRVAAAATAVVLLVGVGVALASLVGDDDEGVVAGPGGSPAPPAEPADGPVRVRVVGVDDVDGTPVVEADEPFVVEVETSDEWMRGIAYEWQAWDGSGWTTTHTLVTALSGRDAEVFGPGDDVFVPSAGVVGSGSARLRAPQADSGWYRVCTESSGPREGDAVSTTAPDGSVPASSQVTGPPESDVRGDPAPVVTACGQARILDPGATRTTTSPEPSSEPTTSVTGSEATPPSEPADGPVTLTVTGSPSGDPEVLHAGAFFLVGFDVREGEPESWTRGLAATWEAWDGERWTPTHHLTAAWGDPEQEPTAVPFDPNAAFEGIGFDLGRPARFIAPGPEAAPTGWYRVCIGLFGGGGDARPCAQVRVDDSTIGANDGPVPPTTTETSRTTAQG